MGFHISGKEACEKFLAALRVERDSFNGERRLLYHDQVRLDSVKAWNGTSEHKLDGSTVEIIYDAYKNPTQRQKDEAEGAKNAGVDLQAVKGRLIDLRENKDGTTLVLMTNGLRHAGKGNIPFRSMNVQKGSVLELAVDQPLPAAQPAPAAQPQPAPTKADTGDLSDQEDNLGGLDVPTKEERELREHNRTVKVKVSDSPEDKDKAVTELNEALKKLNDKLSGDELPKKIQRLVHQEVKRQLNVIVRGLFDTVQNMKDPNRPMPELPATALAQLGGFQAPDKEEYGDDGEPKKDPDKESIAEDFNDVE